MNKKVFWLLITLVIIFTVFVFGRGLLSVDATKVSPIANTSSGNTNKDDGGDDELKEYQNLTTIAPDPEPIAHALEVTCIYSDGKALVSKYSETLGSYVIRMEEGGVQNLVPYEISNVTNTRVMDLMIPYGSVGYNDYNWGKCSDCYKNNSINSKGKDHILELNLFADTSAPLAAMAQYYRCQDIYRRWIINEKDESTDEDINTAVYWYDWDYRPISFQTFKPVSGNNYLHIYDLLNLSNGVYWYGSGKTKVLKNGTKLSLIAERVNIIGSPEATVIELVNKATQTSGEDDYISVGFYGGADVWYIDNGDAITNLYLDPNNEKEAALKDTLWNIMALEDSVRGYKLCFKFSEKELSNSEGNAQYNTYSIPRHEVVPQQCIANCGNDDIGKEVWSCPAGYTAYEVLGVSSGIVEGSQEELQVCDKIPETSKVLMKVLNILQIIVPVLVLIYTCIDITRIVIAGNIEEELPKRKKSIIIRLIVMIAFFFLPFIVRVVFSTIYGTDVGSIECLYED